jgi:hypothetical protein
MVLSIGLQVKEYQFTIGSCKRTSIKPGSWALGAGRLIPLGWAMKWSIRLVPERLSSTIRGVWLYAAAAPIYHICCGEVEAAVICTLHQPSHCVMSMVDVILKEDYSLLQGPYAPRNILLCKRHFLICCNHHLFQL